MAPMTATVLDQDVAAVDPTLHARIIEAFADDMKSADVARLLVEVEAATSAAELAAGTAKKAALDPLLSRDDLKLARAEMEDANFTRDRLHEAGTKLAERVATLKALEEGRLARADHDRVLAERDKLAAEMAGMADAIAQIAHIVREIEACDRQVRRVNNETSTAKFGRIPFVLSGSAPAITVLFRDCLVSDAFVAVAGVQASPVVSGGAGAENKLHTKRSANSQAAL
jgi:hypothetical protein